MQSRKYTKIQKKVKTWKPVVKNGWYIKFSLFQDDILIFFISIYTGQTIIRFFSNEPSAVDFVNYVIEQDPTEDLTKF
jgi:hypothetical protein